MALYSIWFCCWWFWHLLPRSNRCFFEKPKNDSQQLTVKSNRAVFRHQKKPDWVPTKIIYLKAHLPNHGCRKIAAVFNRIHANKKISVSKSYVANVIKQHHYDILMQRRYMKNRKPFPVAKNKCWGIDLTFFTDVEKNSHTIIGICEHHSRLALKLARLKNKSSITLLRCILDAIEKWGCPAILRTDNEPVFTSKLFRFGLWVLGIRHQTTELHCPWQNGKIERMFGTLKNQLRNTRMLSSVHLEQSLQQFWGWYNHVRPHQNLDDKTPFEIWQNIDVFRTPQKHWEYLNWANGTFVGFYPRI